MRGEIRQVLGYSIGLAILMVALKFSFDAIALETAGYIPAARPEAQASMQRADVSIAATRPDNAPPVWIVPTPKYQYDPKLMEVKAPRQLQQEAELRRKQYSAKYHAQAPEAKMRPGQIADLARKAMASSDEPARPSFLMFSPH
ncbi:MAG: hypothetical protein ABWZ64_07075 [Xanthobacteraceae bacterium]